MQTIVQHLINAIDTNKLLTFVYAGSLFIIGYFIAQKLSALVERALTPRFSRHHALLVKRATFYLVFAIFFVSGLQHLGFKLSVLLGAAGVFTVAISFASQTAVSNLISGIFLLFERPFKIGDSIIVKGVCGVVDSIDLLSTKIKTTENTLVRIPNESMMKSEITNLSFFPTRCIDLIIGVTYDSDITQVKLILLDIVNNYKQILKNPAPIVTIENFASYTVELKILFWVKTNDASAIKNILQETIKQHFDQEGIKGLHPEWRWNLPPMDHQKIS